MCSKKCAKPERPGSYSSREPVRTIDQYAMRPSLGIGITITLSPFGSVFVVVGKGMMSVTALASCALGLKVAQTSRSVHTGRSAAARSAIRDDELGMRWVAGEISSLYSARRTAVNPPKSVQLASDAGLAVLDVERREHVHA